ncbi:MAG: orotidine-5'-phosphate decarboxylase [Candidatus Latescibacteria bacterium]|nr:orotidine-5'-phosphate decarboxylase [Candidatus Latescibacterota bacterium]
MTFLEKLEGATRTNDSLVCVGLDVDPGRIPRRLQDGPDPAFRFNRAIIDATKDLVCAYKPNFAFYGAMGLRGWEALIRTVEHVPEGIPVILDAKVGDIGNTAERYAHMAYCEVGADALTVNPYMGFDAVAPFLAYPDRCALLVCLTSNPGSADLQRLRVDARPLYRIVAEKAVTWNERGPCGLVVGATHADELKEVRGVASDLPLLIPGVGAQGGDIQAVAHHGTDAKGERAIVNVSRSVLYASGGDDFAEAARRETERLRAELNRHRKDKVQG